MVRIIEISPVECEVVTKKGTYKVGVATKDLDIMGYGTIPGVPNSNIAFRLDYVEYSDKWPLYYYALNGSGLEIIRKTTLRMTEEVRQNILVSILNRLHERNFFNYKQKRDWQDRYLSAKFH